jgi:hypothetical protein
MRLECILMHATSSNGLKFRGDFRSEVPSACRRMPTKANLAHNTMEKRSNRNPKTAGGKTIHYLDTIEGIRASRELRVEARLTSWEVDRVIRRDFNYISKQVFKTCTSGKEAERSIVRELITEFMLHGEYFKGKSSMYEVTREIPADRIVPIRIVSAEANHLFRALMTGDAAMMRLKCAVIDGVMTKEERTHHFQEFMMPYYELKLVLRRGATLARTASELGEDLGIT